MRTKKNPAGGDLGRVRITKAFGTALDTSDPTETLLDFQPETLAIKHVALRFGIGFHHAQVIVELAGLGGRAA